MTAADPNRNLLRVVAEALGPLRERVVFLGGAAAGLLITDPASDPVRPTDDVDVIGEVATRTQYQTVLRRELIGRGFAEDTSEGAPLCRWVVRGVRVDGMPTNASILGFANRWYPQALLDAVRCELPGSIVINVVTAPLFVATKLEAFRGRGRGDYAASHDLEDVIAVVDGRPALCTEVESAAVAGRRYLAEVLAELLASDAFVEALPGHLRSDPASQARLPIVIARLRQLAAQ